MVVSGSGQGGHAQIGRRASGRARLLQSVCIAVCLAACGGGADPQADDGNAVVDPPTQLSVVSSDASQVSLSWVAPAGATGGLNYRVVRSDVPGALASTAATRYVDANVAASTSYSYQVLAVTAAGRTSAPSNTVNVTTPAAVVKPTITVQPVDVRAKVGGSASFSVSASGTAPLSYRWLFGSTVLGSCTGPTCTINSLTGSHAGAYKVEVSNAAGTATSRTATLTVSSVSSGPVVTLAGCTQAEVKSALASAPAGATIEVGPGDCTWTEALKRYPSVHLKGRGIGKTTVRTPTPASGQSVMLLTLNCTNDTTMELSGFTFAGVQQSDGYSSGVELYGCRDFKVHDNEFRDFRGEALKINELKGANARDSYGVIYNNRFVGNLLDGSGYGVVVYGGERWPALELGERNAHATFIEDNYFEDNRHSVASNYGARYVFRYNTLVNTSRAWRSVAIDAHGIQGPGEMGSRSWEVYKNVLKTQGSTTTAQAIKMRGGDGVIFDNQIDAGFGYSVVLRLEWYENGDERCLDANGDATGGKAPGVAGAYPADWLGQTRRAWIWGNTWGSAPQRLRFDDCEYYFQEGRDFFQRAPTPGELGYEYKPYTYPHPLRAQ